MSIKIVRAVVCDSPDCVNASIDMLRTADAEPPDWQGWTAKPGDDGEKHFCPECMVDSVATFVEQIGK